MKKIIMILAFAVIMSISVLAEDLSDYPEMFIKGGNFNANIVVGNKAPAMHVILQSKLITSFNTLTGEQIIGKAKLASEIGSLDKNLILIGNPCENELEVLMNDYPLQCSYLSGKSGIFFAEVGIYNHLIIAGTDDDIKNLVDDLVNYKKNEIEGEEYAVQEIEPKVNEDEEEANQQKMIEEISRKIEAANATENAAEAEKEVVLAAEQEIKPKIQDEAAAELIPIEENPVSKPGIFKKLVDWFKGLFE